MWAGLFLGEQQGHALVDVLFGDYNPGGKLSTTWYRQVEDLPDFHDYNIRHGRTYMYFRGNPLYPFGHGLSYTTFEYKNLRLSDKTLQRDGKVTISFDVTNSGRRDGDEIVQVYVRCPGAMVERPLMQLVNFERVAPQGWRDEDSQPGACLMIIKRYDTGMKSNAQFVVEPGPLEIMVGASSADIRLRGKVQLTELREVRAAGGTGVPYASIFSTTLPWTSVSRKLRPWNLKVSLVWSNPRTFRIVAWRSCTWT